MPTSRCRRVLAGLAIALSQSLASADPFLELVEVQQADVRRRIEEPVVSPDGLHVYATVDGAFAGGGTAGWRQDTAGTTWTYLDKTPAPPNGIKKISLRDGGLALPGHVHVKVTSKPLGTYAITSADLPPAVTLELGDAQVCTRTGFTASQCQFNPAGTIKCRNR